MGVFDKYKIKEEEEEKPFSIFNKYKLQVGLGIGAKATGGITLPGTTSIKPLIEGLPMSKPEDKPKTLLEQVGVKKPTTPEELKMGVETSLGTWEEQKKANPELQKMEDLAYEVLSIKGRDIPLESKDTHFFDIDIIKKGGSYTQEEAQIAYLYELLTTTEDKAGVPFNETIKDMQFNKIKYGDINPPQESWKEFYKREGLLKTVISGPRKKYSQAISILKGLQDIAFKKENPGADFISSIGWKGMVLLMGSQAIASAMEVTPEIWRKLSIKVENKKVSFNEGLEALKKTGYGEGTAYQRKIFDEAIKQADVENISIVDMLKKGISITEMKPRFAFGAKLYAGLPADEIAKSIIAVGKVTAEAVKGLDPVKVSQVTQMLLNTSPALASEFLKAVEKPEGIPQAEAKKPEGFEFLRKRLPFIKELLNEGTIRDTENVERLKQEIKSIENILSKAGIEIQPEPAKVTPPVEPKEELKAKGKEPVIPLDIDENELIDLDNKPMEVNKDGTITLYHRTTQENADRIIKTGRFFSKENTNETYFSNKIEGQAEGYGDTVITVKVKPSDVRINDAFHNGEIHVTILNEKLSKRVIIPTPKITLKPPSAITPEPTEQYTKIPATIDEAKEILKFDPKKLSQPKELLAKQMIAKKVSLADIEAVKGEKIDVTKPKDILIALRDIKAVKKEVVTEPTSKAIPKEFEPLAEEARKFGSAEEFGNNTLNYIPTKTGKLVENISDPSNWKDLTIRKLIDLKNNNPDFIVSAKLVSGGRGGVSRQNIAIKNLLLPDNLTDFYAQATAGTKAEGKVEAIVKPAEAVTEKPAVVEAPAPAKPPIPPSPPTKAEMAGEPIGDPIAKLNELIKQAKPRRGRLETEYTKERARRIAEVERAIDEIGGEKGYIVALSKLKGQLAPTSKYLFEPIKDKLSKEEIDALYNRDFKHPYLDEWEKISAANELTKLLSGELPTPKGLVLLEEIYGTDLIKSILSKRALGLKVADVLIDVANIPRAILATADMSGFLRQGIVYVVSHPVIATKAMGKTFQFAFNSKSFEQYFKDLPKDKLYPLMRKSGLAVTDPSRVLATGREEAFISRLMQQIPVIGQIIKFAERAYVGFLNKLRVDVFKTFADEFLSKGFSPVKDKDLFKATAEVVNTFTGRGSLGNLNRITPFLNTIFFSPRLIMARFNALNPIWYTRQPKEIRIKALGDFAKFVAVGLTLLAIIKASGLGDVETDPRSSDFGKIKIGNTRWDIWGGFQQWCRVFAQFVSGQRKNTATGEIISLTKEDYPFTTRKEIVLRFIEGKLAPVPALVNELVSGAKTFEGEDITFETVAREKFIPMYIQDITEAYMDGGLGRAVGSGITAFFGVGVQTWEEKKAKKEGFSIFNKYKKTTDITTGSVFNKYK